MDPLNTDAGARAPIIPRPQHTWPREDLTYPAFADMLSGNCRVDGIPAPCAMTRSEAVVQCPNNDCGPRRRELRDSEGNHVGSILTNPFRANADGVQGFFPAGTYYVGDGIIFNSWWTGGQSQTLRFNDAQYGSLARGLASAFTYVGNGDQKKRKRRSKPIADLPIDGSAQGIMKAIRVLPGFDSAREGILRKTILSILEDEDCAAAFFSNFSTTPEGLVGAGTVFGAASLLSNPFNLQMIGITQHARDLYVKAGAVGSTAVQAFTIRNWQGYAPDTVDGLPRIFLNGSAFEGGTYSLREVLVHEFMHAAGWPPGGFFTSLVHDTDLSRYDNYQTIMDACK